MIAPPSGEVSAPGAPPEAAPGAPLGAPLGADEAARYAALALACVHRPYPHQLQHVLDRDDDARPPRALTPVFWGCYDWHSAVHGHWTLAAFARRFPGHATAARARAALATSLTDDAVAGERAYLARRPGFERPYGLAWLCTLHRELAAWAGGPGGPGHDDAARWADRLRPLAELAARRLAGWLERLTHPVRAGTHAQSAFATGLGLDWARATGDDALAARLAAATRRLHGDDRGPALHLEPSGEDFLSPALGAADLMRRVLPPDALAGWLERALPELGDPDRAAGWAPPVPLDRRDGRLVHLDGLCASRAWMLAAVARALPADDPRRAVLTVTAHAHARAALAALADQGYAGGHWLGTFALYLRLGGDA